MPVGVQHALIVSTACLLAARLPTPALAATTTGTILVSVTIPKACTIAAGTLSFGIYASAQLDATGSVTVTCTSTTAYQIGINSGLHAVGSYGWTMAGPSGGLSYKIYRDAGRSTYWGGTQNYDAVAGTGTGTPQVYTAYGRVAGGQYVAAGAYTDTVTFTLYY